MATYRIYNLIENYIYMYHTDTFIILPIFPDSIQDSMGAKFTPTTPLMRSAPIQSYNSSGPRTVQVNLNLHRDMMSQVNYQRSNVVLDIGDDYVDVLVRQIQGAVVPKYNASEKMVNPPMVAMRLGDDIFIKGVISGDIGLTRQLPIININGKDKYAQVSLSFTVTEIDPYDAETVMQMGSFRGLDTTLERRLWKPTPGRLLSSSAGYNAFSSGLGIVGASNAQSTQNAFNTRGRGNW